MHHASNSTPHGENILCQQSTMFPKKPVHCQKKTVPPQKKHIHQENFLQQKPFIFPKKTVLQQKLTHHLEITDDAKALHKNAVEKTVPPKTTSKKPILAQEVTIKKSPQQKTVRKKATVRRISVAELFSNEHCLALHDEYMHESALAKLPNPEEKIASYTALEASGSDVFSLYGAFVGEVLVGFLILLTPVIPHYGTAIAVAESLFVAAKHRSSGAGLLLIRKAEQRAKELGSQGLLFSSPTGGRLATVLPRIGYRETNRVFFKETF